MVTETIIIQDDKIKVVQFLWTKPINPTILLDDREVIEEALEEAINKYAIANKKNNSDYTILSSHKNPLYRLLSRVVVFGL